MTDIAPGLADPPHDSQRLFRALLGAFSHPGRIVALPQPPDGLGGLSSATTALLLTLADRDTPLWLDPVFDREELHHSLRFHTGAPIVASEAQALFAVVSPGRTPLLDGFAQGSERYPDRSATLVIELPALSGGPPRTMRGPGIDGSAIIAPAGLADSFWTEWAENHALFPCGVDIVLAAGTALLALPRSIAVEPPSCT